PAHSPTNYTNIQCCGHGGAMAGAPYSSCEQTGGSATMTKMKSRILAALAVTTALTAPVLIMPLVTAPPAVAGEATHDFADLAAKVTPAVVNVAVTMKTSVGDDEMQMSGTPQSEMEEFMRQFAERFGRQQRGQKAPQPKAQAVGTGFIVDPAGIIVTN